MTQLLRTFLVVYFCASASVLAQTPQRSEPGQVVSARATVTVTTAAPIYVTTNPSTRLAPLRVVPAGTVLRTTGREQGEWLQVQFDDPQWGERTGWIRKSQVSAPAPAARPESREPGTGALAEEEKGVAGSSQAAPTSLSASPLERLFVSIGGGYQAGVKNFDDTITTSQYFESASFDTTYERKAGPVIEGSAAIRLWRTLAVNVGFSSFSKSGSGVLSAEVPHPFFFNQPRQAGPYSFGGVTHKETAVRFEATVLVPAGRRAVVMVGAGPAIVNIKQDVVSAAQWSEAGYPYDSPVMIDGVTTTSESASRVGFSGGVDAAFYFSRNVGVGGTVRYLSAKVPLNDRVEVDAGGVQVGGGLRVRVGMR